MTYNFDEIVDRSQNYAAKFEESVLHYGTNDVIPLWIADMDFRTAPCIVEAIKQRADQGIFGYTWRTPKYFEAIAAWQEKRNGWRPEVEKMAFAPGVVPGMRMILTMFTQPGDKVLIQQPVYHPFADVVHNTGRELVVSPLKRDENGYYTMDYADFEEKAKDAKYFILCNPHNPVGRVWTPEELKTVGDICVRHGVEIISDEIHSDLMLDGHKHTCMASVSPEIAALGDDWYRHDYFRSHACGDGTARIRANTYAFLESLGYRFNPASRTYTAVAPNEKRVALFAHEGFGMAFLSSVLGIPYPLFSTHMGLGHSSMTVIRFANSTTDTEVIPEMLQLSNDSHLYAENLPTRYNGEIPI